MVTHYAVTIGALSPTRPLPDASNTGVDPTLDLEPWPGGSTIYDSSTVIEGVRFSDAVPGYTIAGKNLTFRHCLFPRWFSAVQADGLIMEDCTTGIGNSLSSVWGAALRRVNFSGGSDQLHITGDSGDRDQCADILLEDSYLHGPTPAAGDHCDVIHCRGVRGLTIRNCNLDAGPWFQVDGADVLNSALYIEAANGGTDDVNIERCRLNGGGITFRYHQVRGLFRIVNARIGPDWHYGIFTGAPPPNVQSGNTLEADGSPVVFS